MLFRSASRSNRDALSRDIRVIASGVEDYAHAQSWMPTSKFRQERLKRSKTLSASYDSHLNSQLNFITSGLDDGQARDEEVQRALHNVRARAAETTSASRAGKGARDFIDDFTHTAQDHDAVLKSITHMGLEHSAAHTLDPNSVQAALNDQVQEDKSIITSLRLQHDMDEDAKLQHRSLVSSLPTSPT